MKKLAILALSLCSVTGFAQKYNVTTSSIAIRTYQSPQSTAEDRKAAIEEGKEAIDKAAENPETQQNPEMWYNRGVIYLYILSDAELGLQKAIPNALSTSKEAFLNCVKFDDKKMKFGGPAKLNLTGSIASGYYNNAIVAFNNKNYRSAIDNYKVVVDLFQYDGETHQMENVLKIVQKEVYYFMGLAAFYDNNMVEAREYLTKAKDMKYLEPALYQTLSLMAIQNKDTAQALKIIEEGRDMMPGSSALMTDEINIYIAQHRVDELVAKLSTAIENRPDEPNYYYIRGHSYQTLAQESKSSQKVLDDTLAYFSKQVKAAADPKKKAALQAKSNEFKGQADKLKSQANDYTTKAEQDYLKAIELKSDFADANFNLGALYLNQTQPLVERMNNLPISAEKEYKELQGKCNELYKKAVTYFEVALQNTKDDPREEHKIVSTMRQVYFQLGNKEKAAELRKQEDELAAKLRKK